MSLDTLLLLRDCLNAQQLQVGQPGFAAVAQRAITAAAELDAAIDAARSAGEGARP